MHSDSSSGRLRQAFKRLTATSEELEAEQLLDVSTHHGCDKINGLGDRDQVTVVGHVKSVALAPRAGTPTLEATVFDGSGSVTLVWLGRRKISGIAPGTDLMATGRVSCHDGRRVIYNPKYELQVPSGG